ncbi:MAG TPA: DUF6498-containing protein [Thermoanaerobaculia bacterium]|jgi:hypothetical protein
MSIGRIAGVAQALAINAVSIYGVFGFDWPIGTAIALYWSENILRGLLILVLVGVWRLSLRRSGVAASASAPENVTTRGYLTLSLTFNGAHAVFLAVILGFVIPRMSPAQRFEPRSFRQGLILVTILLLLQLLGRLLFLHRTSASQIQGVANAYVRRVLVIHLTIVFGMFGIVLFDRATLLFATFAALKTIADLAIPLRLRRLPTEPVSEMD